MVTNGQHTKPYPPYVPVTKVIPTTYNGLWRLLQFPSLGASLGGEATEACVDGIRGGCLMYVGWVGFVEMQGAGRLEVLEKTGSCCANATK